MISLLLAWRKPALLLIALLTAALGWSALALRIDPGVEPMIPSGPGDLDRLRAFHALFTRDPAYVRVHT